MNINFDKYYEDKKKNITFETYYIEGVQYNFKMEDIEELLNIIDLDIWKKYLYYLDTYRTSYIYVENYEDSIIKFIEVLTNEDEKTKNKLLRIFLKHENLFKDENGRKQLRLVPKEYDKRIFHRSFV
ncbi:MAG: hypothetical protein IJ105_03885 [Bacilli bacterium]|nr:hypothetical protein [Bacilli bacterium]